MTSTTADTTYFALNAFTSKNSLDTLHDKEMSMLIGELVEMPELDHPTMFEYIVKFWEEKAMTSDLILEPKDIRNPNSYCSEDRFRKSFHSMLIASTYGEIYLGEIARESSKDRVDHFKGLLHYTSHLVYCMLGYGEWEDSREILRAEKVVDPITLRNSRKATGNLFKGFPVLAPFRYHEMHTGESILAKLLGDYHDAMIQDGFKWDSRLPTVRVEREVPVMTGTPKPLTVNTWTVKEGEVVTAEVKNTAPTVAEIKQAKMSKSERLRAWQEEQRLLRATATC